MSDTPTTTRTPAEDGKTLPASSLYRLCEEIIGLRESNARQHKLFEQSQVRARDELQSTFNQFAAETQKAYQQLREQIQGEKRTSLRLLNELLDIGRELEQVAATRPDRVEHLALAKWSGAVAVQARKVMESVRQHGIQRYEAVIGPAYNPALHERVGSKRVAGLDD